MNNTSFKNGYQAYQAGRKLEDNPYKKGTAEYIFWITGWKAAEEDEFGVKALPNVKNSILLKM